MEENTKYFERAIEILFESKEREYRKILYKVASVDPRALVQAVDGVDVTPTIVVAEASEELHVSEPHVEQAAVEQFTTTVGAVPEQQEVVDQLYDAGFTTSQIATAAGVSQTTVYKWKHKTKRPNAHRISLLRILKECGEVVR